MKLARIAVLHNPNAGDSSREEVKNAIENYFGESIILYHMLQTKKHYSLFGERLRDVKPDLLVVAGGDGTINFAAASIKEFHVPVLILPLGSANGFATDIKIPKGLKESIHVMDKYEIEKMDVWDVNGHPMIHLAELGVNATIVHEAEKAKVTGKRGYAKFLWKGLYRTPTYKFVLSGDLNEKIKCKQLSLANCRIYGTGAALNPDGRPWDGVCEVVAFKYHNIFNLIKLCLKMFFGRLKNDNLVKFYKSKELVIENLMDAPLHIDGEPMNDPYSIKLTKRPYTLNVLIPAHFKG